MTLADWQNSKLSLPIKFQQPKVNLPKMEARSQPVFFIPAALPHCKNDRERSVPSQQTTVGGCHYGPRLHTGTSARCRCAGIPPPPTGSLMGCQSLTCCQVSASHCRSIMETPQWQTGSLQGKRRQFVGIVGQSSAADRSRFRNSPSQLRPVMYFLFPFWRKVYRRLPGL